MVAEPVPIPVPYLSLGRQRNDDPRRAKDALRRGDTATASDALEAYQRAQLRSDTCGQAGVPEARGGQPAARIESGHGPDRAYVLRKQHQGPDGDGHEVPRGTR